MKVRKYCALVCSLIIVCASAHAEGKWYTDYDRWLADVGTVSGIAEFNNLPGGALFSDDLRPITLLTENGVTVSSDESNPLWGVMASHDGRNYFTRTPTGQISTQLPGPLTFSFTGNSFGGRFLATNSPDIPYYGDNSVPIMFTTSSGESFTLNTLAGDEPYSFVGYVGDNMGQMNVTLSVNSYFDDWDGTSTDYGDQNDSLVFVAADSFSFRYLPPTNNAVPEPSEWAAMGLLGTGLLGLVVRGRKKKLAN